MSDHTPTPWKYQRQIESDFISGRNHPTYPIYTNGGKFGNPAEAKSEADAEFIVRACNSHDDLLAACSEAVEILSVYLPESLPTLKAIKAAVDKAKGAQ